MVHAFQPPDPMLRGRCCFLHAQPPIARVQGRAGVTRPTLKITLAPLARVRCVTKQAVDKRQNRRSRQDQHDRGLPCAIRKSLGVETPANIDANTDHTDTDQHRAKAAHHLEMQRAPV